MIIFLIKINSCVFCFDGCGENIEQLKIYFKFFLIVQMRYNTVRTSCLQLQLLTLEQLQLESIQSQSINLVTCYFWPTIVQQTVLASVNTSILQHLDKFEQFLKVRGQVGAGMKELKFCSRALYQLEQSSIFSTCSKFLSGAS